VERQTQLSTIVGLAPLIGRCPAEVRFNLASGMRRQPRQDRAD